MLLEPGLEKDPMRKYLSGKLFLAGLSLLIFWALPGRISAQEDADRSGFVLGGWAGYGQMNVDSENISSSSNGTFSLGFSGGYAITSKFVLGVEVNGWTLESYNLQDPSKGESISNVLIAINYSPLFIFHYL
ncbi:MAG: hypothetical protein E4G97_05240 [Deltaproteobacteria bacterium]|nr:MAG: hypothetical protein E4G97_05240 [Deltaproteobacteria bacterium]